MYDPMALIYMHGVLARQLYIFFCDKLLTIPIFKIAMFNKMFNKKAIGYT